MVLFKKRKRICELCHSFDYKMLKCTHYVYTNGEVNAYLTVDFVGKTILLWSKSTLLLCRLRLPNTLSFAVWTLLTESCFHQWTDTTTCAYLRPDETATSQEVDDGGQVGVVAGRAPGRRPRSGRHARPPTALVRPGPVNKTVPVAAPPRPGHPCCRIPPALSALRFRIGRPLVNCVSRNGLQVSLRYHQRIQAGL